ncbi:hypothetical protein FQN50_007193 [Emmonsiellopsis sp. PD_5]|nr:hypothetical protein FQN50_007193 [Emmonsiellopsis sp. PD_5]
MPPPQAIDAVAQSTTATTTNPTVEPGQGLGQGQELELQPMTAPIDPAGDAGAGDRDGDGDGDRDGAGAPLLETPRSPPPRYSEQFGERERDGYGYGDAVRPRTRLSSGGWFIWALTCSAGISGLLFGYDTGVISSTLVSIGSDLSNRNLTTLDKSLITSCTSLFALIASPLAGILGDKLGRKPVILIADVLFVLGALWQAAATEVGGMIVGRSLVGLAVGGASLITPLYEQHMGVAFAKARLTLNRYISELSPPEIRGRLVTILSLFVTGGQVVAYVLGWMLSTTHAGWRWMVGLGALPGIIQLSILLFLPETPRWLVRASKAAEAKRVLAKIYGQSTTRTTDQIVRAIELEIIAEDEEPDTDANGPPKPRSKTSTFLLRLLPHSNTWTTLFRTPGTRRALTIACLLQGLQQLCGFNSLMYFSATIFSLLSFSSPTLTSLSVAITNFLFTLLAFSLIDRLGRRAILLATIPIMTTALLLCAIAFSLFTPPTSAPDSDTSASSARPAEQTATAALISPLLILASLTIYTAAYASGIGTIPWQQSELFPLRVRALGSALSTATNWAANFVVGLTFLPLMEWVSPGWTFVVYAVICAVGEVAVWGVYPEMSGLGLEEVGGLLREGWGVGESVRGFRNRNRGRGR